MLTEHALAGVMPQVICAKTKKKTKKTVHIMNIDVPAGVGTPHSTHNL